LLGGLASPTGTVAGNLVAAPEADVALPAVGVVATPRKPCSVDDLRRATAHEDALIMNFWFLFVLAQLYI
jgi:hypothetical protein